MEQFEELNLKRLAEILFKHIGMIIAVTLIAGILSFIYSETMIVQEFESSVSLYVNNETSEETNKILSSDIAASQMLVDTYIVIVKSERVLSQVCEKLAEQGVNEYTVDSLGRAISASSVDDTEIFEITVRDTNPENTYLVANIIAEVAPPIIQDIVKASSVSVIDYARGGIKVSPNIQTNMVLGLLVGFLFSCIFIVLREIFDMRIKNEEDLEQWFKLPILGVIPDIGTSQQTKKPGYYSYRRNATTYEYRREVKRDGGKSE